MSPRISRNNAYRFLLAATVVIAAVFLPAAALAEGGRPILLHFTPQENTHATIPDLPPGLLNGPIALDLVDDRQGVDRDVIGEVVDDDDTRPLRTASNVAVYTRQVLLDNAAAWGIKVDPSAPRKLTVHLNRFFVSQALKAVGAMYGSEVRTLFSYSDHGRVMWEGSTTGSTHRYGKRTDENMNEVLSDAIKEAFSDGFSDAGLARAVAGHPQTSARPSSDAGGSSSPGKGPISPSQLLADLVDLKRQGFGTDVLVDYVNQRTLSSELTAADLGRWKQAGLSQEVIKAALARSPGAEK